MANVALFPHSDLDAEQICEFDFPTVVLATGSHWRRDGIGRQHWQAVPGWEQTFVVTPDEVMAGATLRGPVLIYDDDHYYLGGIVAEQLHRDGLAVTLVTPAADVSHWTHNTLEQRRIQRHLLALGIRILSHHELVSIGTQTVELRNTMSDASQVLECGSLVMVTARLPEDRLYFELMERRSVQRAGVIDTVDRIGDCLAPSTIAAAVYAGHRFARELGTGPIPFAELPREMVHSAGARVSQEVWLDGNGKNRSGER